MEDGEQNEMIDQKIDVASVKHCVNDAVVRRYTERHYNVNLDKAVALPVGVVYIGNWYGKIDPYRFYRRNSHD